MGSPRVVLSTIWLALPCAALAVAVAEGGRANDAARPRAITVIAVGDIASCESGGDEITARLAGTSGTVLTLGDNAYTDGKPEEFASCYSPSWGRHKPRTRPSPGNHDYNTPAAAGYFGYFGRLAGPGGRGYYSFDLGGWHLVSLNSEIEAAAGSPQERWLRADLARNRAKCTLAYWHKPQFAAADHPLAGDFRGLWQALFADRADLVLNGHEHNYQRFAPQTPAGRLDTRSGIRQIIVGTGGRSHETFKAPVANTRSWNMDTYGVLRLTLRATSYAWRFVAEPGKTFSDSGSGVCR